MRWGVALIVAFAMVGAFLAFRHAGRVVKVTFEMDATETEGTFATAMPIQGQACLVQDLNMRNADVPLAARAFADIENRHRIVLLDDSGQAIQFLEVPSHFQADSGQPVGTRSYCKQKLEGDLVSLRIVHSTGPSGWWMTMD